MSRHLVLRPEAFADFAEAFSWYEAQRPDLGLEFEAALGATFVFLRQVPDAGPVVHRGVRRALLHRFPFAVYYTLTTELIEIRAILHTRRDPRHWQVRREI